VCGLRRFWLGTYVVVANRFLSLQAQAVLSAMVLNVLEHIPDVLTYLKSLKNQSVFNFCAIPQVMAIATLALVFNNKDVYQRNVKIRKGLAVKLITASTNMDNVVAIFREYIHVLSSKNDAADPNFMSISIAVGKVSFFLVLCKSGGWPWVGQTGS
jgi:farnesyl-diphosphate farnesyltransferase